MRRLQASAAVVRMLLVGVAVAAMDFVAAPALLAQSSKPIFVAPAQPAGEGAKPTTSTAPATSAVSPSAASPSASGNPAEQAAAEAAALGKLDAAVEAARGASRQAKTDADAARTRQALVAALLARARFCRDARQAKTQFDGGDPTEALRVARQEARHLTSAAYEQKVAAALTRSTRLEMIVVSDVDEAVHIDPKCWEAYTLAAQIQMHQSNGAGRAWKSLEAATSAAGDDKLLLSKTFVLRAEASTTRPEKLAACNKAMEYDPKNADAFRLRGELERESSADQASRDFKTAIKLDPNHLYTQLLYADALANVGRPDEAVAALTEAMKLLPEAAALYQMRMGLLVELKKYPEALADADKVVAMRPNQVTALLQRAEVHRAADKFDAAIEDAKLAEQLDPEWPTSFILHADLLARLKHPDAGAALLKAFGEKYYPQDGEVWMCVAQLFTQAKQYQNAIDAVNRILGDEPATHPLQAPFLGLRASCEARLGMRDAALADYGRAVEIAPEDPEVLNRFAWLLATSPDDSIRDGARAVKYSTQAAKLTRNMTPYILGTLAAAYAEQRSFDKAIETIDLALEVVGQSPDRSDYEKAKALYTAKQPSRDESLGGPPVAAPAPPSPAAPTTGAPKVK